MNIRGELYYIAARARGADWRKHLRDIERSDLRDMKQHYLARILAHSMAHVPHYRNLEITEPQLEAFPLLSREILRTQFDQLKSDDLATRHWSKSSTGGSTGEPVWVIQDRDFLQWDYATNMYCMAAFCGFPYREYLRHRRVAVWHRRRLRGGTDRWLRLGARLLNQVITIEPYEILSEQTLTQYVRRINHHKPAVILAFSGTMYELARHAMRMNIPVHRPQFILCSVEMLYPAMREMIQNVFGCPVYNRYGAAEVGRIAAECSQGKLHVCSFNNVVEIVDSDGQPTMPGDVGRVVVTSLHNQAMPLVRYDIGDLARVSSESCQCGSQLQVLDDLVGRVMHHFVRSDGKLVFGGNFIAMFYEYAWMMQMYVLQEDVHRIRISYTKTPGTTVPEQDIQGLTRFVKTVMGSSCEVVWEQVPAIPLSPTGKHLHTRSLVWEERIRSRSL